MKLSVVILNYNVRHFLELCLRSVENAIRTIDAEIIVVDNNSSDASCDMVSRLFPKVKLIKNKNNVGFAAGNNIGVSQAKGEYICILNPDTLVAEDTFTSILEFAKETPNLGIVGCQLINGRGQFLPESKRNIPHPKVALKKLLGWDSEYYATQINVEDISKVEILVGAFMFLKKEVYNEINGFDEDYFMYGEDVDISYKSLIKGFDNYYYGKTTVVHFKGESTLKDVKYAKRFYGAMEIFYQKHFKRNIVFNAIVSLGIKLAFLIRQPQKSIPLNSQTFYLLSESSQLPNNHLVSHPIQHISNPNERAEAQSLTIFDLSTIAFKDCINYMKLNMQQVLVQFRFLSANHDFMLGSDSTVERGEIKIFNEALDEK